MGKIIKAITTARVSSVEQLANNSLRRQAEAVKQAAKELGVVIPQDGQWSGSVSSKAGTNVGRKDLREMLEYCKHDRDVRYVIVAEVDRFMRSLEELFYFEMKFKLLGVKVWYALQPELNTDDPHAKLLKALEVFKSEGSNVERINKSIDGLTGALKEGRYPFQPKPGYVKGRTSGVHEIDPVKGSILKDLLIKVAEYQLTPSEALVALNRSEFSKNRAPLKMDKFRHILTDPYYAGVVEMHKQVQYRNEHGVHEPLITMAQHNELLLIMTRKKKNQKGPSKDGNPKYPLSNYVNCSQCATARYGRFAGFDLSNGRGGIYEKYRCRSCGRYISRNDLHTLVSEHISKYRLTPDNRKKLVEQLKMVWSQQESDSEREATIIRQKITLLNRSKMEQIEILSSPANATIREELLESIEAKKKEVTSLEKRLKILEGHNTEDKSRFLSFALKAIDEMSTIFLELSPAKRALCEQLLFPGGFDIDLENNVHTPEMSAIYRLAGNKKDLPVTEKSSMVRVRRL